MNIAEL